MHVESLEMMSRMLNKYNIANINILDVGSMNVKNKGCYKSIMPAGINYIGDDILPGINVDVIINPDKISYPDNYFGAVISGQCFEHCENPFILIKECARVLKPGGYFIGVAPYEWPEHHKPDYWRILADGWKSLFKSCELKTIETVYVSIELRHTDSWGIAQKCI